MEKSIKFQKKDSATSPEKKLFCFITNSAESTEKIGVRIAKEIKKKKIRCVVFYGPFGAGKTTMIRGIIKGLTGKKDVVSPSFIIVNEYTTKDMCIYHCDFYRIKSCIELESFGFREYLEKGLLLIEWPETATDKIPENSLKISMEFLELNKRKITILFP